MNDIAEQRDPSFPAIQREYWDAIQLVLVPQMPSLVALLVEGACAGEPADIQFVERLQGHAKKLRLAGRITPSWLRAAIAFKPSDIQKATKGLRAEPGDAALRRAQIAAACSDVEITAPDQPRGKRQGNGE